MTNTLELLRKIEEQIEGAVWDEATDGASNQILERYETAKKELESVDIRDDKENREHKRILSYCLMRIDETLNNLGDNEKTLQRSEESLKYAIESGDSVQIARSRMALGIRLLNQGSIREAESHFADIIKGGIDSDDRDMKQVVGWTLLVRANILKGKSLYQQALHVALNAAGILSGIKNYAGLEKVYSLMSKLYMDLGDSEKAEDMKDASVSFGKKAKELRQ